MHTVSEGLGATGEPTIEDRATQKARFDRDGFITIPNLLSPEQLAALRARIDQALSGAEPQFGDFDIQWEPAVKDDPTVPREQRIRVMFHLCHRDHFFWEHATRPEILDVIENLLGPDIKLYTDQLFVKPPHHGSDVAYHQDSAYWPIDPPALITCWVAIDEATVENGCVHVIPGSHRMPVEHRDRTETQSRGILPAEVDVSREVPVSLPAGGAMFHHSLLIHRSHPNSSPRYRRGLATIYLSANSRLSEPWDFKYGFRLLRGRSFPGCI